MSVDSATHSMATAAITRAKRELPGATTIVACAARHNASHAVASLANRACPNASPCTASNLLAAPATCVAAIVADLATIPTVNSAPSRAASSPRAAPAGGGDRFGVAPVHPPRRPVLRGRRRDDGSARLPAAVPCARERDQARHGQHHDERAAGRGGGRHPARWPDRPASRPALRAARAAARAGAGDRASAQPELRGHDPPGGRSSASP